MIKKIDGDTTQKDALFLGLMAVVFFVVYFLPSKSPVDDIANMLALAGSIVCGITSIVLSIKYIRLRVRREK